MGASPSSTKDSTLVPWANPVWLAPPLPEDIIYGIRDQTTSFGTYRPECKGCHGGGCDAGECSYATSWDGCNFGGAAIMYNAMGDGKVSSPNWATTIYRPEGTDFDFGTEECYCSKRPSCTRPDPKAGLLGKGTAGYDPLWLVDWTRDPSVNLFTSKVRFSYDISKIDKFEQVEKYRQLFYPGANDPNWLRIMNKMCVLRTSSCPVDPTTGKKISDCSLATALVSTKGASVCQEWLAGLNNQNLDSFVGRVCQDTGGPIAAECKCQLRSSLPEYKTVTENIYNSQQAFPDACIWTPCKSSSAFLVNSRDRNPTCPTTLCQTIYSINGVAGNVEIQKNQNYLSCKIPPIGIDPTTGQPTDTAGPATPANVPVQPPHELDQHTDIKTIGLSIIVILLLLAFGFLWSSGKK